MEDQFSDGETIEYGGVSNLSSDANGAWWPNFINLAMSRDQTNEGRETPCKRYSASSSAMIAKAFVVAKGY